MKAALYFCGLILGGALVALDPLERAGHDREPTAERQQILLPTARFNEADMEMQFRGILSGKSPEGGTLLVEALDRENSAVLFEMGVNDASYALWETLYSDYKDNIPPVAELLKMGRNAAMRLRDQEGRVWLKVLEGESPYDLHFCGRSFALAHLSINTGIATNRSPDLHFFLTTDQAIDERIARCARGELQRLVSVPTVDVSIRNDAWFLLDPDYPVVLPFLKENRPPTKEEYEAAQEWSCGQYEGQVFCSQSRRRSS
jgi:hypothetical protein